MQKNNRRSSSNLTELELLDDLRQENELLKTELAKLCKQISDAPAIAEGSLRDDHCTQIQLLKGLLSQEKARYEALKSRTSVVESELDRSEHNTVLLQLHSNSLQDELQRTKSEMELSEKENLILSSTIDSMTSKIKLLEDMVHEKTEENGVMEIALEKANRDLVIVCKDNQGMIILFNY